MSFENRRFATRPASRSGSPLRRPPVRLALGRVARTRRKPPLGTGIWAPPLLALLLASAAQAQQTATVSGVVVDAATNQPISGVEVRVEGLELLAVSGGDGGFSLEGVPIRELRLVFRHLG
jgi:hypothetical protein